MRSKGLLAGPCLSASKLRTEVIMAPVSNQGPELQAISPSKHTIQYGACRAPVATSHRLRKPTSWHATPIRRVARGPHLRIGAGRIDGEPSNRQGRAQTKYIPQQHIMREHEVPLIPPDYCTCGGASRCRRTAQARGLSTTPRCRQSRARPAACSRIRIVP